MKNEYLRDPEKQITLEKEAKWQRQYKKNLDEWKIYFEGRKPRNCRKDGKWYGPNGLPRGKTDNYRLHEQIVKVFYPAKKLNDQQVLGNERLFDTRNIFTSATDKPISITKTIIYDSQGKIQTRIITPIGTNSRFPLK